MTDFKLDPEDFYLDDCGNMVFTEVYLRKRKFCCKSGCRHCPYDFGEQISPEMPTELIKVDKKSLSLEQRAEELLEEYKDIIED